MGDHHLCDGCGMIFEWRQDQDGKHCDGCNRDYCNWCDGKSVFHVGDDTKCWLCYNPYDRVVSEKELLYFCLDKLGWDKKTVDAKFRATKAFKESLDGTTCTDCGFDGCTTLDKAFVSHEEDYLPLCRAGVCCACQTKRKILIDTCDHCNSRAFMERWIAPHRIMRDAGIPKDVVVHFAKRIKKSE